MIGVKIIDGFDILDGVNLPAVSNPLKFLSLTKEDDEQPSNFAIA